LFQPVADLRLLLRLRRCGEAVKKWDWLRAETTRTLGNHRSRRCLSHFFHSLGRLAPQPGKQRANRCSSGRRWKVQVDEGGASGIEDDGSIAVPRDGDQRLARRVANFVQNFLAQRRLTVGVVVQAVAAQQAGDRPFRRSQRSLLGLCMTLVGPAPTADGDLAAIAVRFFSFRFGPVLGDFHRRGDRRASTVFRPVSSS
jgi:hypothetical protein